MITTTQPDLSNEAGEKGCTGFHASRRQVEVLALIAEGKTDKEIARVLHVSPATVRTYLRRLYAALGVHSRAQAVASMMAAGHQ